MSTALLIKPARRNNSHHAVSRCRPHQPHRAPVQLPRVVSATSLGVDAEVRAMERPCVPNYALRRMIVGAVATVALVVGMLSVVALSAGIAGAPASAAAAQAGVASSPSVHVAQSGDTMWSIATTYRGDVDRDRFITALIRLNGGVEIQAGQAVRLP